MDVDDRSRVEKGELALKMFELSQTLEDKWLTSDYRAKRRLLEMVCLNFSLHDVNLDMTLNKVFSALTEDLVLAENRGGPRTPFVNEISGSKLLLRIFPQTIDFAGDAVLSLVEKGLYKKSR